MQFSMHNPPHRQTIQHLYFLPLSFCLGSILLQAQMGNFITAENFLQLQDAAQT